jgi:hypothetical protein
VIPAVLTRPPALALTAPSRGSSRACER